MIERIAPRCLLGLSFSAVVFLVGCGGGSPAPTPLSITNATGLPSGTVTAPYSATFSAQGGTPPYVWSVTAGRPAPGLALGSSGVLAGTPTAAGTTSFSVEVKDSASSPQTATLAATLVINSALKILTSSPLTPATIHLAYATTLAADGGTPPYAWSLTAGTLPAGLSLTVAGVLSGTPFVAASDNFSLQVKDSGSTPQIATLPATLAVSDGTVAIVTAALPLATIGASYNTALAASGGTPPYKWRTTAGALPTGLALSTSGILSGTPSSSDAGIYTLTLQATDSASTPLSATAALALPVSYGTLSIPLTALPNGNVGVDYLDQLYASGGVPLWTWTASSLPPGLSISTASGVGLISGRPTVAGTADYTVTATDAIGETASATLSLAINPFNGVLPDNAYTFVFSGTAPQSSAATQSAIAINGSFTLFMDGIYLGGEFDQNGNINPAIVDQDLLLPSLGNLPNGLIQLSFASDIDNFTFIAAPPPSVYAGGNGPIWIIGFQAGYMPVDLRGSGILKTALLHPSLPSGNFSFLFTGSDVNQREQALIGSFQTDGAGNITGGHANSNEAGVLTDFPTVSGSYSVSTSGPGSLQLKLGSSPSTLTNFNFSFYEVSPAEWLVISTDRATVATPLISGSVKQQTAGPFSASSLPPNSVVQVSGLKPASSGVTGPDITAGFAASDGSGNIAYSLDEYNGALAAAQTLVVNYAVDPATGRAVSTGNPAQPILYIIDRHSAFYLGADPSSSSGILEEQTGAPFTSASFSGNYFGGSLPLVSLLGLNECGLVSADGKGNVTFTTYRSGPQGLVNGQSVTGTYTVDSQGRVTVTTADGLKRIFYIVSPNQVAYMTSDTGGYLGSFEQ